MTQFNEKIKRLPGREVLNLRQKLVNQQFNSAGIHNFYRLVHNFFYEKI